MSSYVLTPEIIQMCEEFAEKCSPTNKIQYTKRNQTNPEKIKKDIRIGKMGEFAVYHIMLEKKINDITQPDLNIYLKTHKSFDSDLKCNNYNLHVKSQCLESASRFGISWMFQKEDPIVTTPSVYDYFIGTIVDEKTKKVEVKLSKPVKDLVFGEPVLDILKKTKVCVYLKNN
jgi:hypothetical protein